MENAISTYLHHIPEDFFREEIIHRFRTSPSILVTPRSSPSTWFSSSLHPQPSTQSEEPHNTNLQMKERNNAENRNKRRKGSILTCSCFGGANRSIIIISTDSQCTNSKLHPSTLRHRSRILISITIFQRFILHIHSATERNSSSPFYNITRRDKSTSATR